MREIEVDAVEEGRELRREIRPDQPVAILLEVAAHRLAGGAIIDVFEDDAVDLATAQPCQKIGRAPGVG